MAWQSSKTCIVRLPCLITLCCVLLSSTPVNNSAQSLSFPAATTGAVATDECATVTTRTSIGAKPATATTVSPAPPPPPDGDETPNPVRRFFSWIIQGVTRPFRRRAKIGCQLPPMVTISASNSSITLPCPRTTTTGSANCPTGTEVTLSSYATDPGYELFFTWSVTAGRIRGEGRKVTWDLSGVPVGTYTATIEAKDAHQHTVAAATTVAVSNCKECEAPPPMCPALSVSCPDDLEPNKPITFEAKVTGGEPETKATITWSVTAGKIISGQGTSKITVSASETERRRSITATASLDGVDPSCSGTASCTINIDGGNRF